MWLMRFKKPNAAEMTVEQFADELRRIRERAWHIFVPIRDRKDYHRDYYHRVRRGS